MTFDTRPHVLHVITDLGDGGAEGVLYRLVTHHKAYRHSVISLSGRGKYGPLLEGAGIAVDALDLSPSLPSPVKLARLVNLIRKAKPQVVQTWMYHGDLFGGLAARMAGKRVVWGIRSIMRENVKFRTSVVVRLNAALSWVVPDLIVSCSEKGAAMHAASGYSAASMTIVPNGYDLSAFRPKPGSRGRIRAEFSISDEAPLFGCVARHDPDKDHPTLLAGFARVAVALPKARLVLVGTGMSPDNTAITSLVDQLGLTGRVLLAGRRSDIPDVMNALDVHVLASTAEAFPNVLNEAMACGTPCVATDVGDCALIIGETGEICQPSDPESLAGAMVRMIRRRAAEPALGEACRARITERFSLPVMVAGYSKAWEQATRAQRHG